MKGHTMYPDTPRGDMNHEKSRSITAEKPQLDWSDKMNLDEPKKKKTGLNCPQTFHIGPV